MFVAADLLILSVVFALARMGFRRGFTSAAIDLFGFTLAIILAIRFYRPASAPFRFLRFSDASAAFLGGLLVFVPFLIAVAIIGLRLGRIARAPGLNIVNRIAGTGFGILLAAVLLTFAVLVSQFAPLPLGLTDAIHRSTSGRLLLKAAEPAAGVLSEVAERDAEKVILYLRQSLRPPTRKSEPEAPPIKFTPAPQSALKVEPGLEKELFDLTNKERSKRKLKKLIWDKRLSDAGRRHADDMYLQGYFAHSSPDGTTPGQRLTRSRIDYILSAENLALAPSVSLAHDGLMKSPGHRRNILDKELTRLGIGIYSGPQGLVAAQEFCAGC